MPGAGQRALPRTVGRKGNSEKAGKMRCTLWGGGARFPLDPSRPARYRPGTSPEVNYG